MAPAPRSSRPFLLVLSLLPGAADAARAQAAPPGDPGIVRAVRASSAINVDGRLDEAAWAAAPTHSGFVQRDPDEGQPSSQLTEVSVLYDSEALYIGGRLFDADPRQIRARLARRDEPIWNADVLEVYIDSQNDGLSAYVFRITPAGAMRDATMDANLGQDNSWDAVWEGAAVMDSLGWSTELRIPFGQLRYTTGAADSVWGIQFSRVIGWRAETSFLPARPKMTAQSPADWARLVGLSELPRRRQVELVPYVATRAERLGREPGNPFRDGGETRLTTGADLRYGLTNNLTLSATVNPDFGQVEVDLARINLTHNELFFAERRPFFVERAETFRFGQARVASASPLQFHSLGNVSSASGVLNPFSFDAFHSRRIGRAPQRNVAGEYLFVDSPEEATIAGALKLTGRTSRGLSIGVLDAVTMREDADVVFSDGERGTAVVEPMTNYLVARARQELRGGNTVAGALLTAVNRDLADPATASELRRDSYFTGLDFQQSWRQREWSFDAAAGGSLVAGTPESIAATQTSPVRFLQRPDRETHRFDPTLRRLRGTTWHAGLAKNSGRHWLGNLFYREVSPGLEVNDVGFQTIAGFRAATWSIAYKEDAPGKFLRNYMIRPHGLLARNWDGFTGRNALSVSAEWTFNNFWQVLLRPEWNRNALDPYLSRGGPVMRRADYDRLELALISDRRKAWSTDVGYVRETDDVGSWFHSFNSSFDWRPFSQLRLNASPGYVNRLARAQYVTQFSDESADATFGRRYVFGALRYQELSLTSRVDWTFSPVLSLQLFAQPLIAAGEFLDIKSLTAPRTLDFEVLSEEAGTLARDEQGLVLYPSGVAFRIRDPNFKTRTLVGNAVVRWEYRPGSALFFVWQQRRDGFGDDFGLAGARDLRDVFGDQPQNIFVVKGTYWMRW
jgi:hypothetical protein